MEHLVDEFLPQTRHKHHDALADAQNLSKVILKATKRKSLCLREFLQVNKTDLYDFK